MIVNMVQQGKVRHTAHRRFKKCQKRSEGLDWGVVEGLISESDSGRQARNWSLLLFQLHSQRSILWNKSVDTPVGPSWRALRAFFSRSVNYSWIFRNSRQSGVSYFLPWI